MAYAYPGSEALVLDDVSLAAGPGLTVVTGESGAGKSTLLDLVAGVRTPTAGASRHGRVHYVTQRPFLPDGTIEDALRLGTDPDLTDADLWAALRRVGLGDVRRRACPHGLETPLGDDGFGLSAGQRLRLGLARAAPLRRTRAPARRADRPPRPAGTELVLGLVRDLAADRCVVAATHSPELVVHRRRAPAPRARHGGGDVDDRPRTVTAGRQTHSPGCGAGSP